MLEIIYWGGGGGLATRWRCGKEGIIEWSARGWKEGCEGASFPPRRGTTFFGSTRVGVRKPRIRFGREGPSQSIALPHRRRAFHGHRSPKKAKKRGGI